MWYSNVKGCFWKHCLTVGGVVNYYNSLTCTTPRLSESHVRIEYIKRGPFHEPKAQTSVAVQTQECLQPMVCLWYHSTAVQYVITSAVLLSTAICVEI